MGGILLAVLFIVIGTFSFVARPPPAEKVKEEQRQTRYLEQKVGQCDARGGVARLDPISGYLGCDLPILRTRR
jgi:hypothetical protein